MRFLKKFGYLGCKYTGFQRGNGTASVEDAILKVLKESGTSHDMKTAARTDREVSAFSNALFLESSQGVGKIMGILNSSIDGAIFHSYAELDSEFNPRHCDRKRYRYLLRRDLVKDLTLLELQLQAFKGRHDFSAYSRHDSRNPIRAIDEITIRDENEFISIDFVAKSFLWNQIRSIIAFSLAGNGTDRVLDPFISKDRFPGIAAAMPLILVNVEYDGIEFKRLLGKSKLRSFQANLGSIIDMGKVAGTLSGELLK